MTRKIWYQAWDSKPCMQWVGKPIMVHTPVINVKDPKKHWSNIMADWHVKDNGWSNPGYTFVIEYDGTIYFCAETANNQIHCRGGGQNKASLGCCLVGDGTKQEPSINQISSLHHLTTIQKSTEIRYHRDFAQKECPGDKVIDAISRSNMALLVMRYNDRS